MDYVVIFDPDGVEPEGEILEKQRAAVANARGVVSLPVVPALLSRNAFAGWSKRSYGRGWKYDPNKAGRGCPLAIHVDRGYRTVNWVARIVRDEKLGAIGGSLRLAADTAQMSSLATGIINDVSPPAVSTLGDADSAGGWTISGRATVNIPGDAFIGFQLYGQLSGARVAWFAASQSE